MASPALTPSPKRAFSGAASPRRGGGGHFAFPSAAEGRRPPQPPQHASNPKKKKGHFSGFHFFGGGSNKTKKKKKDDAEENSAKAPPPPSMQQQDSNVSAFSFDGDLVSESRTFAPQLSSQMSSLSNIGDTLGPALDEAAVACPSNRLSAPPALMSSPGAGESGEEEEERSSGPILEVPAEMERAASVPPPPRRRALGLALKVPSVKRAEIKLEPTAGDPIDALPERLEDVAKVVTGPARYIERRHSAEERRRRAEEKARQEQEQQRERAKSRSPQVPRRRTDGDRTQDAAAAVRSRGPRHYLSKSTSTPAFHLSASAYNDDEEDDDDEDGLDMIMRSQQGPSKGLMTIKETGSLHACSRPGCSERERSVGEFGVCGRCHCAAYCSEKCQEIHWAVFHRKVCEASISPPPSGISLPAKISRMRSMGEEDEDEDDDDDDDDKNGEKNESKDDVSSQPPRLIRRSASVDSFVSQSSSMSSLNEYVDRYRGGDECESGSSSTTGGVGVTTSVSSTSLHVLAEGDEKATSQPEEDMRRNNAEAKVEKSRQVQERELATRDPLPLPPRDVVQLVLFDMDKTLLNIHTGGCYQGQVETLSHHVVWEFVQLVPRLLDAGFRVGVVTFSDALMARKGMAGEPLVRELLKCVFARTIATDRSMTREQVIERVDHIQRNVHVAAAHPQLQNQKARHSGAPMPVSKQWHIERIVHKLRLFGDEIEPHNIMLFDDSRKNIKHATRMGVHAFLVDKSRGFSHDVWEKAVRKCQRKDL